MIMKQEKGITLVALIIIIAVLLILSSIIIKSGTQSINNTKLDAFYMRLDIVRKRVDDIATTNESYVDSSGNTIYLMEKGKAYSDLTSNQKTNLTSIIQTECSGLNLIADNFRYFTKDEIESILGLSDINYNLFIDFNTRVVIAETGIMANGQKYHISPNTTYFVEKNTNKNVGTIQSLHYNITAYGTNSYKIVITPSNKVGDLGFGTLKYKKITSKYWEISNNLEMVISQLAQYNIIYKDANNNILSKTINVSLDSNGNPVVTEI